jgi:glutamyl-tRNA synthetase
MILGPDGKRLSKRHGATSVEAFGERGFLPEAMVNFLALLGWSLDGTSELFTLAELEKVFTLERVNPSPAVFDTQKLEWMNAQHLKRLDEADRVGRVTAFLAGRGHALASRGSEWCTVFVRALGERLRTLADAEDLGAFVLRESPDMEPAAWADLLARAAADERLVALADALRRLPEWTTPALEEATRGLAKAQGVKAGEVITPARIALTGRTASPGIFDVMWLVGRDGVLARLERAAAGWRAESPLAARA